MAKNSIHYVSVVTKDGGPVVSVRSGKKTSYYPLTKAGCLDAGRAIFKSGAETWLNSSSVDHPKETWPRCRLDIRGLMQQGFQESMEEADKPRKELVGLIVAWCSKADFQRTLTPKQVVLFRLMKKMTKKGG